MPASSAQFLLTHFDRLAEAPGGIAKLRALIYELASTGRLTQADNVQEETKPLGKLADFIMGQAPPGTDCNERGEGTLFVKVGEFGPLYPEHRAWTTRPLKFAKEGDVLICVVGATVGKINLGVDCAIGRSVAAIRPSAALRQRYLYYALMPFTLRLRADARGSAQGVIGRTDLSAVLIWTPSLEQQDRVVAKVEELMGLCDALEAAQREREAVRTRLRTSALHQLASPDSDSKSATFVLQNISRLTSASYDFDQLRKSVLLLAVCGRLVPQRSEDKPATLDRVASSSTDFDERVFSEASRSLAIPTNWSINPLARTAAAIVDCPHSTPKWTETGKMCVRTNQFRPGYLDLSDVQFVSEETYIERIQRLKPEENDILYSREGGILGVACRIPANTQLCLGQRMMLFRSAAATDPAFLEMVLNSPLITEIALNQTTGGAAPRVNVSTIRAYPIPLPPLAEQRRIVAKVDELMAVLDALEATLTAARTTSEKLLAATIAKLHAA